jgi:hypothetical protein
MGNIRLMLETKSSSMSNYAESRTFRDFIYSTSRSCVVIPGVSSSSTNPSSSKSLLVLHEQSLTSLADAKLLPINSLDCFQYAIPFRPLYTTFARNRFRTKPTLYLVSPPHQIVFIVFSSPQVPLCTSRSLVVCFHSLFSYIISSFLLMIV